MNYSELSKLSVEELRNVNQMVIELIKQKRTIESLEKKLSLQVVKINRTKANLRVKGGFGSYNVPVSMIEY